MDILTYLIRPLLFLVLTLTTLRMIYLHVVVMRRMARPGGPEDIPPYPQSSEDRWARTKAFMREPEHRPLRRQWAASWIWVSASLLVVIMYVLATSNGA